MSVRIDSASRLIHASPSTLYQAFAKPGALESWLPPKGMTGTLLAFEFREGGRYRMVLSYDGSDTPGKTSEHADEVEVRFVRLVPDERIEQAVTFRSEDPQFTGEMRVTWALKRAERGTVVTVCCEDVPDGIRAEDHEAGLASTLENLAQFTETQEK